MNNEMNLILLLFEGHDLHNQKHAQKTAIFTEMIAEELEMPESKIKLLKKGALLHDIGKLLLPHDILNKPRKLDKIEKEVINEHPEIGANLLKEAGYNQKIVEIAKYHHEWWDGSGYPEGLKGDQIPRMAQIVSIISAFDVMTSSNIYSSNRSIEEAVEELKDYSNIQFSPELVELFCKIVQREII
ncbi:MAG: HD-GYP domain-containing protein [Halanaerobium sp.]